MHNEEQQDLTSKLRQVLPQNGTDSKTLVSATPAAEAAQRVGTNASAAADKVSKTASQAPGPSAELPLRLPVVPHLRMQRVDALPDAVQERVLERLLELEEEQQASSKPSWLPWGGGRKQQQLPPATGSDSSAFPARRQLLQQRRRQELPSDAETPDLSSEPYDSIPRQLELQWRTYARWGRGPRVGSNEGRGLWGQRQLAGCGSQHQQQGRLGGCWLGSGWRWLRALPRGVGRGRWWQAGGGIQALAGGRMAKDAGWGTQLGPAAARTWRQALEVDPWLT